MARKKKTRGPSNADIRRLLKRYGCPVPLHAVRTRFIGSIASPKLETSPMQVIAGLWEGGLPEFDSEDDANEFFGTLVMGLWNQLSGHRGRKNPFYLQRMRLPQDGATLARYSRTRVEELEGLVEGLFGDDEKIDLPERAHEAIGHLAEMRSFFAAYDQFADDPGAVKDLQDTHRNLLELTRIAEHEISALLESSARARRQQLQAMS